MACDRICFAGTNRAGLRWEVNFWKSPRAKTWAVYVDAGVRKSPTVSYIGKARETESPSLSLARDYIRHTRKELRRMAEKRRGK